MLIIKLSTWQGTDQLKDDKEVVLTAIKNDPHALKYASEKLKNNKEFIKEATKISSFSLEFANYKFRDDKDVMLIAVENYPPSLELASERLKNDIEVVRRAVEYNTYVMKDEDDNEKTYQDDYVFDNLVPNKIKEQYPTIEALLNSEKEITNENPWSKGNENKTNAWADKVNSDKSSDLER